MPNVAKAAAALIAGLAALTAPTTAEPAPLEAPALEQLEAGSFD